VERLLPAVALVVAIASCGSGHHRASPADARLATLARSLPLVRDPRLGRIDVDDVHGPLLEFDLAVPAFGGGRASEALWQGEVFTGAAAIRLAAGGTKLVEVQETLVAPDGSRRPVGGGLGRVVRGRLFAKAPPDLALAVAANAAHAGLRDARTEVLHGLGDALDIHARTEDVAQTAAALRRNSGILAAILGSAPTRYEGVFLEIDDLEGDPVYVQGVAVGNGSSMMWTRPGLDVPTLP
jgi:hypothetical protein